MECNLSFTIAAGCADLSSRSFLKRILLVLSLLPIFASVARAQTYPEFDGVYFKMNDESFAELPLVGNVDATAVVTLTSEPGLHPAEWLWHPEQYANVPVVDLDKAQTIIVVGSSFRKFRYVPFNSFNDQYRDFISDPRSTVEFKDYVPNQIRSTDLSLVVSQNFMVRGSCGLDETVIRVRRISDFITELQLQSDGYSWPSRQNFRLNSGCESQPTPAQVIEVVVDGKYYAFRPKASFDGNLEKSANAAGDANKLSLLPGTYVTNAKFCDNPELAVFGRDIRIIEQLATDPLGAGELCSHDRPLFDGHVLRYFAHCPFSEPGFIATWRWRPVGPTSFVEERGMFPDSADAPWGLTFSRCE